MGCCTDMAEAICVGGAATVDVEAGALLKAKRPSKGASAEPAHWEFSDSSTHASGDMTTLNQDLSLYMLMS